ncbi:MAG: rod shape-determining protein RodA [Patescibacteria group bacterium]
MIFSDLKKHIDWLLFFAILPILVFGLVTMSSFSAEDYFFEKQLIWIAVSLLIFFGFSFVDFRFMKRTEILVGVYLLTNLLLLALFVFGSTIKGAESRFDFGFFFFQPAEIMKIVLILVLAKYFSRRHIEIAHFRHIVVSGVYAFLPFVLIFLQPDLGSAIIIFLIWFGMILVSGISKKHLAFVFLAGALAFSSLWFFAFEDYQKDRILSFVNPLADIQGAGYNAYQSTIAVGSGQIFGKGIGYGTQSKLRFLPEYQTDFIFAAFAEEWGYIGVIILFALFAVVIWRVLANSLYGTTNFEILFGLGFAIMLISHFAINIGMNIGLAPITGITIPFMSYGGTHLMAEFAGLGILMGMRRYSKGVHRDDLKNEFLGI